MAKPSHRRRQRKASSPLLEMGQKALVIGMAMLLASAMLGGSPKLAAVSGGIQTPAWWAIGIGIALLGVHALIQKASAQAAAPGEPVRREPMAKPVQHKPVLDEGPGAHPAGRPRAEPSFGQVLKADLGRVPENARATEAETGRHKESRWSAAVFAAIEWRRFEAVCEALFAQAGFETRAQSHGADGGVDIWLHSKNAQGPVAVVQCKHWQGKAVGVKEMREFLGVMASHGLKRGTYATTSTFTPDAQAFAGDNGISALNGKALLDLIGKRTPEQQSALLEVAYEGEYWRPTCASCGIKLVERTPAKGGRPFWGCTNYPRCKSTLPMRAT